MIGQQITFGSKQLHYHLKFSERKTLGINIHPSGHVVVTAPVKSSVAEVKLKVRKKAPWIIKQIDHFDSYKPLTPPRKYISGESHLYLGRQYRLKIMVDKIPSIKAYRGQLWVKTSKNKPELVKMYIEEWYRQRASDILYQILDEVMPKFKKYSITKPSLTIRKMSKRWGSCTSSGKIILNLELMKAPKGCIEYVIIHEICHLIHYNHTKDFHVLLKRMMPDWYKWKCRLEQILI